MTSPPVGRVHPLSLWRICETVQSPLLTATFLFLGPLRSVHSPQYHRKRDASLHPLSSVQISSSFRLLRSPFRGGQSPAFLSFPKAIGRIHLLPAGFSPSFFRAESRLLHFARFVVFSFSFPSTPIHATVRIRPDRFRFSISFVLYSFSVAGKVAMT